MSFSDWGEGVKGSCWLPPLSAICYQLSVMAKILAAGGLMDALYFWLFLVLVVSRRCSRGLTTVRLRCI
jgi:hypothetical protein